MKEAITYSDILIEPQLSSVTSRANVDLSTNLGAFSLKFPVISANMRHITGPKMAAEMSAFGGMGILYRWNSPDMAANDFKLTYQLIRSNILFENIALDKEIDQIVSSKPIVTKHILKWLKEKLQDISFDDKVSDDLIFSHPVGVSIGVKDEEKERFEKLYEVGARIFCIDVNHGHHVFVKNTIEWIKKYPVVIIAGNIATKEAAQDLQEWGANLLKVGIGPGGVCMTRRNTGVGVPQISALINVCEVAKVPVIADGGIQYIGDFTKALAVGADAIMIGSYIAGTSETPGKVFRDASGKLYKVFGGSASGENKMASGSNGQFVEGVMKTVEFKGHLKHLLREIKEGLQSGFSLSGASTLREFQQKVKWNIISRGSQIESKI